MKELDKLRRDKADRNHGAKSSSLTQEEKEQRIREMQAASLALRDERRDRSGFTAAQKASAEGGQRGDNPDSESK